MATDVVTLPKLEQLSDRLPPQDLEAEQATLGAMLVEAGAVERALQIVSKQDFYREGHRYIFSAIEAVHDSEQPVDVVTVGAELRRRSRLAEVGGGEYLTALIGEVPTTAHVVRYATIVHDKAVLRRLIRAGAELQALAYKNPEDPGAVLGEAEEIIQDLRENFQGGEGARPALERADEDLAWLREQVESPAGVYGMRTGISTIDRKSGGLGDERLVLVLAETKCGKSSLCLQTVLTSALDSAR
ncbi:MAG: replicative DNA helicase, partial [Armatimonadota bacterium]